MVIFMKINIKYRGFFLIELMVALGVLSFMLLIINLYMFNLYKLKIESTNSMESFCLNEKIRNALNSEKNNNDQKSNIIKLQKHTFKLKERLFKESDIKKITTGGLFKI
jgi:biopolymer transport protein ExbB/TolQ